MLLTRWRWNIGVAQCRLRGVYARNPRGSSRACAIWPAAMTCGGSSPNRHIGRLLAAAKSESAIRRTLPKSIPRSPNANIDLPQLSWGSLGPVLCFSRRKAMLDLAARLGIGKFHANFIIASVQQRMNESGNGGQTGHLTRAARVDCPGERYAALVVQSILVVTLWAVLK